MAQQTAVMELLNFILVERRSKEDGSIKFHANEDFERFLEMEKEQIENAYLEGESDGEHLINSAEQYYNETYKK